MSTETRCEPKLLTVEEQFGAFMSPDEDLPPTPRRMAYLICSSPRTGSGLLCSSLQKTQMAGKPAEYLHPMAIAAFMRRIGVQRLRPAEYVRLLCKHRTTSNGVFGMKLHFYQFKSCFEAKNDRIDFLSSFDHIILLSRRNKLAQAISNTRALQTDVWYAKTSAEAAEAQLRPVSYDAVAIARSLAFMLADNAGWRSTLATLELKHRSTYYEELVENFPEQIRNILTYLALGDATEEMLSDLPTPRLGTALNANWEERFFSEIGGQKRRPNAAEPWTPAGRPAG